MKEQIAEVGLAAEKWSPQQTLAWAFETFGNRVAISSAFGAEGMVLIDIASRVRKDFRLFTIDTEFLFPETYSLMDKIEERYGFSLRRNRNGSTVQLCGAASRTGAATCGRSSRSGESWGSLTHGSPAFAATRPLPGREPARSSGM